MIPLIIVYRSSQKLDDILNRGKYPLQKNHNYVLLSIICFLQFHKVWGQLMKTGYQNSRFAHQVMYLYKKNMYSDFQQSTEMFYLCISNTPQVERFACLYCSQVTDFGLYSPNKYYRPSEDYMPHEFDVLGL